MAQLVRLGLFSPSVVLGVARATGALERAGLTVEEVPATSSAQQFGALVAGALDAVLTSPDNVLAYRGSAANPLGRAVDARILAAVDRGLGLSLFAAPDIDPGTGLRGGVLAVDVPTSGFAFVAYELLARRGLRAELDYAVRPWGATPRRATALAAGECTMTVLNAGGDLRAEAAGCTRVARAVELGPYLGTVLAALGPTVEDPSTPLRALTEVILATGQALTGGKLNDVAAKVTSDRLGLAGQDVARYLATLADPREGLAPHGRVDAASLETLRWLRGRHGGTDPSAAPAAAGSIEAAPAAAGSIEAAPVAAGSITAAPVAAGSIAAGSGLVDERFLTPSTP